ncbi:YdbH domain-containing protein [Sphingomonas alpina]|uniref:YdbH domain-containing protein n=1 Tax=Sphingomonas alpina TaxID=653931 RepID=UPI0021BA9606|nr:YdbH domain-containing protein [Sphingomonas alpina]
MTADPVDLPDAAPERRRRRRALPRLGRGARIIAVIALVLLGALMALWTQRKTIASNYVDSFLAENHVPARYSIADLGFDRQRLTNVVLGDPAHPDLVADWIELRTNVGFSGASVDAVRAGHVRLRGKLIDGKISLGALDRLLPAPSGKPFALPAIGLDVADGRMRLETPHGVIGLKLSGRGRLDDGFAGTLAAVSDRLDAGSCIAEKPAAALKIRITKARPSLTGPVRAVAVTCGDTRVAGLGGDLGLALSETLDRWTGKARLAVATVRHPQAQLAAISGTIGFAGTAAETKGRVDLAASRFGSAVASGSSLAIAGDYRIASQSGFTGTIGAGTVALAKSYLAPIGQLATMGQGTPVGPIVAQLAKAAITAGNAFSVNGDVAAVIGGNSGRVDVSKVALSSPSGLEATLDNAALSYGWPKDGVRIAGQLDIGGGGFPLMSATLAQSAPGKPVTGVATLRQPYTANGASLALTPVRFSATPGGNTRVSTRATLSGPLGDGRVDGLSVALDGAWNGGSRLLLNPVCTPLSFQRLAVSGLVLRPASLDLCPVGGALMRLDNGRLGGGATIAAPRLAGNLGSTPVTLAAAGSRITLGDTGFGLTDLAVRLGTEERLTRLDFATLDGRLDGNIVRGSFAGGAGQIGKVPLLMSAAAGDWTLEGGRLGLHGAMSVADAEPDPRFKPLAARDVVLTLVDSKIAATGTLVHPEKGVQVATVAIVHDLSDGAGKADLAVAGLNFNDKFQPDELTRLTFGVIANVAGTVAGTGQIRWNADAVTSDGVFRTANVDLAAAFGPVTGIAGEIHFTDLLNLESAPGQVVTIKTINPGIPVNEGRIVFRTLAGTRVQVESGDWPLAGGQLVLEPTLLDFTEAQQRRMTFRVTGMDAGKFLQQFDFDNLNATGTFDGSMPMIFDQAGGRIENGHLTMRAGGGTVAYLGEVTQEDVGFWGNLAFQALKSLRYRNLEVIMNGPLAGEMITEVRFAGVGQGDGAKRNFLFDRLQKLPFVFNVRITAPFRQLIDSAQSFYDPKRLIERNLPALIEEQKKRATPPQGTPPIQAPRLPPGQPGAIQPQESRTVP